MRRFIDPNADQAVEHCCVDTVVLDDPQGLTTSFQDTFTASLQNSLWPTIAISGYLSDRFGYFTFFCIVMVATIPSFFAAWFAPFPRNTED